MRPERAAVRLVAILMCLVLAATIGITSPATAAATGAISGVVTGPGGDPVAGATVSAYRSSEFDEEWHFVASTTTDALGAYALESRPAGAYIVGFTAPDLVGEFWDNAIQVEEATGFTVYSGATRAGIDAALVYAGDITGAVTDTAGTPLEDVTVSAYASDALDRDPVQTVTTSASGVYDLQVPSGSYRVEYAAPYWSDYVSEFWPNVSSIEEADDITVSSGQVMAGTDASLAKLGRVSGKVTGPSGQPIARVEVRPYYYDQSEDFWYHVPFVYTETAADGTYDLGPLEPGTYRLGFEDYSGNGLLTEFWSDAATVGEATDFQVTNDHTVTAMDAQLAVGGQVRGVVTDTTGAAAGGTEVTAYRLDPTSQAWEELTYGYADSVGRYVVSGLPSGVYRLRFDDSVSEDHLVEYWDDAGSLTTATDIVVGAGATATGRDVVLADDSVPSIVNTSAPIVTGTAQVGSALTATAGEWTPATGLDHSYRWFVGGEPAPGATSPTYVPTSADLGKTIQVQVRATRPGYTSRTASSSTTVAVAADPAPVNTIRPGLSRNPRVGSIVTAIPGVWTKAAPTFAYQWLVGGNPVLGAIGSAYRPVAADAGKQLYVRVTATGAGDATGVATSLASVVAKGTLKPAKKPKVSGKAKKNATLTVSPGTWMPAKVKVTYQWFTGTKAIAKATTSKLKLVGKVLKAVKKKAISVVVTITAPGYTSASTRLRVPGKTR